MAAPRRKPKGRKTYDRESFERGWEEYTKTAMRVYYRTLAVAALLWFVSGLVMFSLSLVIGLLVIMLGTLSLIPSPSICLSVTRGDDSSR